MKKLIFIFLSVFVFSCQVDNKNPDIEVINNQELGRAIATAIFNSDLNTKILKNEFSNLKNRKKLDSIINEISEEIFEMENYSFFIDFFYNSQNELLIRSDKKMIDSKIKKDVESREMDCLDYQKCKKCYSEECVAQFMSDALDEYGGCAEFKIDKHRFYANVYARPCGDD